MWSFEVESRAGGEQRQRNDVWAPRWPESPFGGFSYAESISQPSSCLTALTPLRRGRLMFALINLSWTRYVVGSPLRLYISSLDKAFESTLFKFKRRLVFWEVHRSALGMQRGSRRKHMAFPGRMAYNKWPSLMQARKRDQSRRCLPLLPTGEQSVLVQGFTPQVINCHKTHP